MIPYSPTVPSKADGNTASSSVIHTSYRENALPTATDFPWEMWYTIRARQNRRQETKRKGKYKGMFFKKVEEFKKVVREVAPSEIVIPEERVRRIVPDPALTALADSLSRHGMIEPIIVRQENRSAMHPDGTLEQTTEKILVAGERRLRAAMIRGWATVPCICIEATQTEAAVIAIIENLHREDLNLFEEALAIRSLIALGSMTQETCAKRLSVSQSYIANKLRLLRMSPTEQEIILQNGLSERHARAVLRLPGETERTRVLEIFVKRQMNVASAEEYVESMICAAARGEELQATPEKSELRRKLIVKDIRLFYNSIDHAVDVIKKSGIPVESSRKETDAGTLIEILLPKKAV